MMGFRRARPAAGRSCMGHSARDEHDLDGPFMSLILLALSGNFFLNAYWEMRHRVSNSKRAKAPSVQKTS
jgi:hypothetical protein